MQNWYVASSEGKSTVFSVLWHLSFFGDVKHVVIIGLTFFALQEDRFYEEHDEDEESDEPIEMDRCGRFRQAYQVALATDTQGFYV